MSYLIISAIFLGVFVLPVYLAFKVHKKREEKIVAIESKCTEIIILADKIINDLRSENIKEEDVVLRYQAMKMEDTPFLSEGSFMKTGYTTLEISNPSEHKSYTQLEDYINDYNFVAA